MGIVDRIYQIVDNKEISISEFSKRIGVSNGYFAKQRLNNANVGSHIIEKIVSEYTDINLTWLILGNGEMFLDKNVHPKEEQILSTQKPTLSTQNVHPEDKKESLVVPIVGKSFDRRVERQEVPLYDFDAVAGLTPVFNGQGNPVDYISIPNLAKVDGAVHVCGDSMYPLLKSGDIVMYKIVNDLTNIIWGEMYLISISYDDDEYISVKYLRKSENSQKSVILASYNPNHAPKEIPIECIRSLALIKAVIHFNVM